MLPNLTLPFPQTNFQPLLAQIPGLGVDVVGSFFAGGGAVQTVTQTAYDGDDRAICVAVRMNAAAFPAAGADACVLGTTGSDGPDRLTRTLYDAARAAAPTATPGPSRYSADGVADSLAALRSTTERPESST